jgi:major membrane immunogen (membrane-anchored lipoprotein)
VVGEEVAAAEKRVRAVVDSLLDQHVAPVRARVTAATDSATALVAAQRGQLNSAQKALEQGIKELTRLPGFRLP